MGGGGGGGGGGAYTCTMTLSDYLSMKIAVNSACIMSQFRDKSQARHAV